jgi:SSS family solute:Na+ symporter
MNLPIIDITIIIVYIIATVLFGSWFVKKNRTSNDFMTGGGSIPSWAIGLSFFGTYLSSNTFIGVVGRAFSTDWNYFVFSLAIPISAWICVKYFVPFYRKSHQISAYQHMEERFGPWARSYTVICWLFLQLSRIATITFGLALAVHGLTGWSMEIIIIVSGISITLYTFLGGMKAVIWTDVIQSFILIIGAILLVVIILIEIPGGTENAISIAKEHGKFSLGSFSFSFRESTFWVVLLYGLFMNLKAFGFDQAYVQRYHSAKTEKDAKKSLWLGAMLYLPISLVFFFIGSILFSYYQTQPDLLTDLKRKTAVEIIDRQNPQLDTETRIQYIDDLTSELKISEIGDNSLPHFMANRVPVGMVGLIIAAILAAAMSTISTCLNSSATIMLVDLYKRYFRPNASDKESMIFLRLSTILFGIVSTGATLLMIGIQSVLAVWWQLTGIFSGAMLGLFLLGFIVRKADNVAAVTSVIVGILVIIWMTFSSKIECIPDYLRSPFHTNMIVVISTLIMFLVGLFITKLRNKI